MKKKLFKYLLILMLVISTLFFSFYFFQQHAEPNFVEVKSKRESGSQLVIIVDIINRAGEIVEKNVEYVMPDEMAYKIIKRGDRYIFYSIEKSGTNHIVDILNFID